VKRGKGQQPVPLGGACRIGRADIEPAKSILSADRIYERRWALTLMEQVLRRLRDEYVMAGNTELFDLLKQLLPE